jgi:putative acetyltransferase
MQRRGIGSALVRHGIERARMGGFELVLVLGAPKFYGRFGFSAEAATAFPSAYSGSHFMALRLTERPHAPEPAVYAEAFDTLS